MLFKLFHTAFLTLAYGQFIFDNHHTCSFEDLSFPRSTYRISSEDLDVYVNLCEPISDVQGCDKGAFSCAINKTQSITNGGAHFALGRGDIIRTKKNGMPCNGDKFSTVVHVFSRLQNSSQDLKAAWIINCEIHVRIPDTNSDPECTTRIDGFLLNLLPLRDYKDLIVDVPNSRYKVALSICRPTTSCGNFPNVMGCEVRNDTGLILQNQHFLFDDATMGLQIRSHSKDRRNKRTLSMNLHCDWNIGLKHLSTSLRKGKIIVNVASKYGCIKFPMNCTINLDGNGNHYFNISELNNNTGWFVTNSTNGKLRLNVCGPLHFDNSNECSDKHSQICLQENNNYLSLGVSSTGLKIVNDYDLYIDFHSGSICPKNTSTHITSTIIFKCGPDSQPVIKDIDDCHYIIYWYTKHSCPKKAKGFKQFSLPKTYSCHVNTPNLSFDVTNLMNPNEDKVVKGSDGLVYYINLCRSVLIEDCENSVFCFKNTTELNIIKSFKRLGSHQEFYVEDEKLFLKYSAGVLCQKFPKYIQHDGKITFKCSNKNKLSFINKTNFNCTHNFLWETDKVCLGNEHEGRDLDCIYTEKTTDHTFDFNGVKKKEFIIEEDSIKYQFNICKKRILINGKESDIAPGIVKFDNCSYSLNFNLNNNQNFSQNSSGLQNIIVNLQCDDIVENEHFTKDIKTNCSTKIDFWTTLACTDIEKHCPVVENSSEQPSLHLESYSQQIKKSVKEQTGRNCRIYFNTTSYILLKDLPLRTINTKNASYSIGFGGTCDDFVCKNGRIVGSISELCPNVRVDLDPNKKEAIFLGFNELNCLNNAFSTHVNFICKETLSNANIYKETNCSVHINLPLLEACDYSVALSSIKKEYLIGAIGGIVLLIACIILIFPCVKFLRQKNYFPLNTGNKSSTKVYLKDTMC